MYFSAQKNTWDLNTNRCFKYAALRTLVIWIYNELPNASLQNTGDIDTLRNLLQPSEPGPDPEVDLPPLQFLLRVGWDCLRFQVCLAHLLGQMHESSLTCVETFQKFVNCSCCYLSRTILKRACTFGGMLLPCLLSNQTFKYSFSFNWLREAH